MGAGVAMVAVGWLTLFFSFRDRSDRGAAVSTRWRVAGAAMFALGTIVCLLAI
jgi:uncharacterized membrane protein